MTLIQKSKCNVSLNVEEKKYESPSHKQTSKLVHVVVQKTPCITQKLVSSFSNLSALVYFKDFTYFSY
jgi:hypothetical protein